VHLEPVQWRNDWPIIGAASDGQSTGQPVPSGPIPGQPDAVSSQRPQTSDDFGSPRLAPQWEWNHNPDDAHWSLTARPGHLRLLPLPAANLASARNTLTQCMQDNAFDFTIRLDVSLMKPGVHAGLAMFEQSASGLEVIQTGRERRIAYFHLQDRLPGPILAGNTFQLRVRVEGDQARYSYSLDDGASFHPLGSETPIHFSWWKGSRPALFAYATQPGASGSVDFDWVHYAPLAPNPW
jgi:beta-xylosidase